MQRLTLDETIDWDDRDNYIFDSLFKYLVIFNHIKHTVTSKVASLPILFKLFVNSKYNMKLNMMHTYRHACIHTYLHTWHRNVISNRLPLVRRGFEPGLLRNSLASRLECLLTKRLRYRGSSHLNSIACPAYDEQAFRPLDTTSKMDLPLALPIYIFVV